MQNSASTFFCACPSDFTGQQCETSTTGNEISIFNKTTLLNPWTFLATHVCVTRPDQVCQNGGTCNILGTDYVCNCAIGFSGRNCETQEGKDSSILSIKSLFFISDNAMYTNSLWRTWNMPTVYFTHSWTHCSLYLSKSMDRSIL